MEIKRVHPLGSTSMLSKCHVTPRLSFCDLAGTLIAFIISSNAENYVVHASLTRRVNNYCDLLGYCCSSCSSRKSEDETLTWGFFFKLSKTWVKIRKCSCDSHSCCFWGIDKWPILSGRTFFWQQPSHKFGRQLSVHHDFDIAKHCCFKKKNRKIHWITGSDAIYGPALFRIERKLRWLESETNVAQTGRIRGVSVLYTWRVTTAFF